MKKRLVLIVGLFLGLLGIAACGAAPASAPSGGVSSAPVPIELPALSGNLADVPRMTDPVVGSISGSVSKHARKTADISPYGIKLGSATSTDFPAGSAYMACGEHRSLRNTIGYTAFTDYALCILQKAVTTDLTSGDTYYATLSGTPTPRFTKAKFSITTDSDSNITDFTMFGCSQYGNQIYYSTFSQDGTAVTMRNKFVTPDSGISGPDVANIDAQLTGTINSSRQYTNKTIRTQSYYDNHTTMLRYADATFSQPASDRYSHNITGGSVLGGTASSSLGVSSGSLVDYNTSLTVDDYNINLLGLSDGAARVVNYDVDGNQTIDFAQGWAWNGSMMAPDVASSYLITVAAATLPERISSDDIDIAYSSAQTWDCSIPSSAASDHVFTRGASDFSAGDCEKFLVMYEAQAIDCDSLGLSMDN